MTKQKMYRLVISEACYVPGASIGLLAIDKIFQQIDKIVQSCGDISKIIISAVGSRFMSEDGCLYEYRLDENMAEVRVYDIKVVLEGGD
jgi:hypothetical protein